MPLLINELITSELWRHKIFRQFFKFDFKPKNTFEIYLILYHEATLVNLLETVLYHPEGCLALDDTIYDLIDYAYRTLTAQVQTFNESKQKITEVELDSSSPELNELLEQSKKIEFDICMKLFSIVRYIVDNIPNLPLGVANRILNKHDFIMLLVQAIDLKMWSRTDNDGKCFKYVDNKWKYVTLEERSKLSKVEGQVWIALYELLLNPACAQKYDYTDFKKNQVVKLRCHINEVLIDQIPNLAALLRFLEQLAVTAPPAYKSDLIIEQISEIYESKMARHRGKWKEMARKQADEFLAKSEKEVKERARRWVETFGSEAVEGLIDEPAKCGECGEAAPKRCSRCQCEWYCRRECQVKNWPKHKKACDMIFNANEAVKKQINSEGKNNC